MAKIVERIATVPDNIFTETETVITLDNNATLLFPAVKIVRQRLFHGSCITGIRKLTDAESTTIGAGVYLTSEFNSAADYALARSPNPKNPIVYEATIETMKLLDLTKPESLEPLATFMDQEISSWIKEDLEKRDPPPVKKREWLKIANSVIRRINEKRYDCPKDLLGWFGDLARWSLSSRGLDGIKATEYGESKNGYEVGKHDTFVIFEPSRVKVISETQTASHLPAQIFLPLNKWNKSF